VAIEILPSKLYKYRSLATAQEQDRVREIVLENKIYFPSAKSFNDPFDLNPSFDLTAPRNVQRKDYERLSKNFEGLGRKERRKEARLVMKTSMKPSNVAATTRGIQAEHARAIAEKVGVLCLSKKRNDILMWSHYADSHKGVCLEFDGMSKFMAHAQEVKYSKVRDPIRPYYETQEQMMEKALLTKSCHWTYEDEYRLLRYTEGPGLVEFRPHNLIRIIVGANADDATLDLVKGWIGERVEPLRLSRASVSKTKFEVLIDAVG
jgi:hypothetical protein